MVLLCPNCGPLELSGSVRFCSQCGAKIVTSSSSSATKTPQNDLYIQPLAETATRPVERGTPATPHVAVACKKHSSGNVVVFCQTCQELACIVCASQDHSSKECCGELIPLDKFIGTSDPFKQQRGLLSDSQRKHQGLLGDLKTIKSNAKTDLKLETSKLRDLERDVLKVLDEAFDVEFFKLRASKNGQRQLIQDSTSRKIKEVEQSVVKTLNDLQTRIDDVTTHLQDLRAADHKLAPPLEPSTLTQHIEASKEAQQLLNMPRDTTKPRVNMVTITTGDSTCRELQQLAELPVEVQPKHQKKSVWSKVFSTKPKPAKEGTTKTKTEGDVPLTGKASERYFVEGVRVVRGPDWISRYDHHDGGGPGSVTRVEKHWHGEGLHVDVTWDRTGHTDSYSVGVRGQYRLQLLSSPTQQ